MALFNKTMSPPEQKEHNVNDIASLIQRRRYQLLVHSLLYYELDISLISDATWSKWAVELSQIQKSYPDEANSVVFSDAFKDFDGSTGFNLPYKDEQIINIAYRLIMHCDDVDCNYALHSLSRIKPTVAQYKGFYKNSCDRPSKPLSRRKEVKKVEPVKRKKLF